MLQPGAVAGLKREDAMRLVEDMQALIERLEHLRRELRRLADE
jgi:hypothetical protein